MKKLTAYFFCIFIIYSCNSENPIFKEANALFEVGDYKGGADLLASIPSVSDDFVVAQIQLIRVAHEFNRLLSVSNNFYPRMVKDEVADNNLAITVNKFDAIMYILGKIDKTATGVFTNEIYNKINLYIEQAQNDMNDNLQAEFRDSIAYYIDSSEGVYYENELKYKKIVKQADRWYDSWMDRSGGKIVDWVGKVRDIEQAGTRNPDIQCEVIYDYRNSDFENIIDYIKFDNSGNRNFVWYISETEQPKIYNMLIDISPDDYIKFSGTIMNNNLFEYNETELADKLAFRFDNIEKYVPLQSIQDFYFEDIENLYYDSENILERVYDNDLSISYLRK